MIIENWNSLAANRYPYHVTHEVDSLCHMFPSVSSVCRPFMIELFETFSHLCVYEGKICALMVRDSFLGRFAAWCFKLLVWFIYFTSVSVSCPRFISLFINMYSSARGHARVLQSPFSKTTAKFSQRSKYFQRLLHFEIGRLTTTML